MSKPAGKAAAKPAAPAAPTKVQLPQGSKEHKLFRDLTKCTDSRKLKRAIRCADTILKKYPDHAETLALKGLNLAYMDKKDEAFDHVKRGVKADITGFLTWQMHGLVHRQYREHPEAARCFQMALRNCPQATHKEKWLQLLRELALEQVMSGDYKGFSDSRRKLLEDKPGQAPNWMASAASAVFLGDLGSAVRSLDAYESITQADKRDSFEDKYSYSEMLMFKASLLEQLGEFDRALQVLRNPDILDKLAVQEQRASIHLKRKDFAEAEKLYRELVAGNTENLAYHRKLLEALQIASFANGEEKLLVPVEKLLEVYDALAQKFPKSHAAAHFPLRFLTGAPFRARFEAAVRPLLRKGVPALFNSCKGLYKDASRVAAIEELISGYLTALRQTGKFPGSEQAEDPTVLLWTLVFAAQHYNEVERWARAFELIDEAIAHSPTIIDLYVFKSRFYKKAGDADTAAALMEKARQLDLADRYLNTRATRYLLRANQPEKAERVVSLFTTDMETGYNNLPDMQVAWWRQNSGDAHARLGQYGLALKHYMAVQRDYDTVFEDQADFHSYCARKHTLRAYMDLMRLEETLHGQRAYARALRAAVDVYLQLHLNAGKAEAAGEADSAEAKKAEAKRKKAEAARKAEEEEAAKRRAQEQARANAKRRGRPPPVDNDPLGEQLLKVADPLAEAAKHLRKIYSHNTKRLDVQLSAFEVYYHQKRLLLALQSIKRAQALAPQHPGVHRAIVRFFRLVDGAKDVNATVAAVIQAERAALLGGADLAAFNKAYAAANAASVAARAAAAEMSVLLNPAEKAAAVKAVSDTSGAGSVTDFVAAHRLLASWDAAAAAAYKEAVLRTRLPYATYFGAVRPKEEEEPKDD